MRLGFFAIPDIFGKAHAPAVQRFGKCSSLGKNANRDFVFILQILYIRCTNCTIITDARMNTGLSV